MTTNMFCFQCEQTAGCQACTGTRGVCGKDAATANLQDNLTAALIDVAVAIQTNGITPTEKMHRLITEGLFATLTNVNFDGTSLAALLSAARNEQERLVAAAPSSVSDNKGVVTPATGFCMETLWDAPEDVRSCKSLVLFGLRGMAAYAYHARTLGYTDEMVDAFFYEGLAALAQKDAVAELLPIVLQTGEINLKCLELLDRANTATYGHPAPTTVVRTVEPGPFIVVTGHDLRDLELLLKQTAGQGVNVYTHGEMLPAHAYPQLAKYSHLKGNLGTAWQNQQHEFANLPAPVLFTTNCLMPPENTYADRVFTTGTVSFPHTPHIDNKKDFSPVIKKALELGGFTEKTTFAETEQPLVTGFAHNAVLGAAEQVVAAVKSGELKHIFLVGGCDGARAERNYFTEFVQRTPSNTLVLTLGCGKYRFNDLDLGEVAGLPRLLDMGQCNDAYSAIAVAVALAKAFDCTVNELPLSLVLSWYEQKAVCILLTLLHLGIKGIKLGPTLPAFVSPGVLDVLVNEYQIAPITTPEQDLAELLA